MVSYLLVVIFGSGLRLEVFLEFMLFFNIDVRTVGSDFRLIMVSITLTP